MSTWVRSPPSLPNAGVAQWSRAPSLYLGKQSGVQFPPSAQIKEQVAETTDAHRRKLAWIKGLVATSMYGFKSRLVHKKIILISSGFLLPLNYERRSQTKNSRKNKGNY